MIRLTLSALALCAMLGCASTPAPTPAPAPDARLFGRLRDEATPLEVAREIDELNAIETSSVLYEPVEREK